MVVIISGINTEEVRRITDGAKIINYPRCHFSKGISQLSSVILVLILILRIQNGSGGKLCMS